LVREDAACMVQRWANTKYIEDELLIIVQIETLKGVENLEEIVRVEV